MISNINVPCTSIEMEITFPEKGYFVYKKPKRDKRDKMIKMFINVVASDVTLCTVISNWFQAISEDVDNVLEINIQLSN